MTGVAEKPNTRRSSKHGRSSKLTHQLSDSYSTLRIQKTRSPWVTREVHSPEASSNAEDTHSSTSHATHGSPASMDSQTKWGRLFNSFSYVMMGFGCGKNSCLSGKFMDGIDFENPSVTNSSEPSSGPLSPIVYREQNSTNTGASPNDDHDGAQHEGRASAETRASGRVEPIISGTRSVHSNPVVQGGMDESKTTPCPMWMASLNHRTLSQRETPMDPPHSVRRCLGMNRHRPQPCPDRRHAVPCRTAAYRSGSTSTDNGVPSMTALVAPCCPATDRSSLTSMEKELASMMTHAPPCRPPTRQTGRVSMDNEVGSMTAHAAPCNLAMDGSCPTSAVREAAAFDASRKRRCAGDPSDCEIEQSVSASEHPEASRKDFDCQIDLEAASEYVDPGRESPFDCNYHWIALSYERTARRLCQSSRTSYRRL